MATKRRAIRERERTTGRHIPIIAMTASAQQNDQEACLKAGMDDFLSKPVRQDALSAMLNRWMTIPSAYSAAEITPRTNDLLNQDILNELRMLDANEPGVFDILTRVYLEDAQTHLDRIHAMIAATDAAGLAAAAHRLRGGSASFGAQQLSWLCAELEQAARQGHLATASRLAAQVEPALAAVRRLLQTERDRKP